MTSDRIQQALRSASDTRACVVGRGVVDEVGAVFAAQFPGRPAILVADGNTWAAAGERTAASLRAAGVEMLEPFRYPASPTLYASYDKVEEIREHLRDLDAIPVSVSSGTLNDLLKRACSEIDREYMCVATAASMDGYIAFGASITKDGFKQQMTCPAPAAIVADVDIMAGAPPRLTATGFGDLSEKLPAGADWIIADELGIEPMDHEIFELMQGAMPSALADPRGARDGDPGAIEGLADGLMMAGLAIQAYKTSRPGSGGGHHFSHIWEMEGYGLDWEPPLSHGFKVALGSVATTALYELVLSKDIPALVDVDACVAAWPSWEETQETIREKLPAHLVDASIERVRGKYVDGEGVRERVTTFVERWPRIKERIEQQLMPVAELQARLDAVGAPTHPEQIRMDLAKLEATYDLARWIRDRYVLTDILTEAGLFDSLVDELFAPGGYWAEREVGPSLA